MRSIKLWSNVNLALVILVSAVLMWVFIFMPSWAPMWLRIAGVLLTWMLVGLTWWGEKLYIKANERALATWETTCS